MGYTTGSLVDDLRSPYIRREWILRAADTIEALSARATAAEAALATCSEDYLACLAEFGAESIRDMGERMRAAEAERDRLAAEAAAMREALELGDLVIHDAKVAASDPEGWVQRAMNAEVEAWRARVKSALATDAGADLLKRVRRMEAGIRAMGADHMTSEQHHPGYVLVPTAAFDDLRAALDPQP